MRLKKRLAKIYFKLISRKYHHQNGIELHYLLKKNKSEQLLVMFSGFSSPGMPATYNYMKTTDSLSLNKLFILDNFGYQKLGAYYLYENGSANLEEAVTAFLKKVLAKNKYRQVIFAGSSKGGYAALYYGAKLGVDIVIAGAPQYFLGNYLTDVPEKEGRFKGIVGDPAAYTIEDLNMLLPNQLKNASRKPICYIHYSTCEHTFEEHIKAMLTDLETNHYLVYKDPHTYEKHQQVAIQFPLFLVETLNKIIRD